MNAAQLYRNIILTAIAFCLIGILVQNQLLLSRQADLAQSALNQTGAPAAQFQSANYAELHKFVLVPLNANGAIDVNLKGVERLDVNIDRISSSEILQVDLRRVYGDYRGTLKVNDK